MFALMTWNEYYRYYIQSLRSIYSPEEATIITTLVFSNKCAITRNHLITSPGTLLSPAQKEMLDTALALLLTNKPVQQVIGEAWFYNLRFAIDENILIPRPETEELVKWILDENAGAISIIDIGSGSGCIPVALKYHLPAATVSAIDISDAALTMAKQNAVANNACIHFYTIDFLNREAWAQLDCYNIIVSNPPYIPISEKVQLHPNVSDFEPGMALFVPDNDPLVFYKAIAEFACIHLKKEGKVYVEIHQDFAKETAAVFLQHFANVEIKKDINGNERMIKATQIR